MIQTRMHGLMERLEFGLSGNGSRRVVIEEACKGNACVEESMHSTGCYREYLIQKLLPAIKQRWPMNNGRIWLQQDGAKSHILEDNKEFKEVVDEIGLTLP